ncbi:Thaumatin protein 1 [Spatholobus suberectus]|nr:Thaumatin protein 1 [Spatholobus suberectus]
MYKSKGEYNCYRGSIAAEDSSWCRSKQSIVDLSSSSFCDIDAVGCFRRLLSGKVECVGGARPPATLAEFTLKCADGLDFYNVSLVDGYNLPMLIVAKGGTRGGCSATGCLVDLNGGCPAELRVARVNGSRGSVSLSDPIFKSFWISLVPLKINSLS